MTSFKQSATALELPQEDWYVSELLYTMPRAPQNVTHVFHNAVHVACASQLSPEPTLVLFRSDLYTNDLTETNQLDVFGVQHTSKQLFAIHGFEIISNTKASRQARRRIRTNEIVDTNPPNGDDMLDIHNILQHLYAARDSTLEVIALEHQFALSGQQVGVAKKPWQRFFSKSL